MPVPVSPMRRMVTSFGAMRSRRKKTPSTSPSDSASERRISNESAGFWAFRGKCARVEGAHFELLSAEGRPSTQLVGFRNTAGRIIDLPALGPEQVNAMQETREYDLWFLVTPAPDIPGEWVGHCLTVDVVSQGTSVKRAFEMAAEAATLTIVGDILRGDDFTKRRAPEKDWKRMYEVVNNGERVRMKEVFAGTKRPTAVAASVKLRLALQPTVEENTPLTEPQWELPMGAFESTTEAAI